MGQSHGRCISFDQAITWAEGQPDSTVKGWALNRLRYERDKARPVPPKFHKGHYGHKYDHWTCGNCGAGLNEAHWKFCPNCGYKIGEKKGDREK